MEVIVVDQRTFKEKVRDGYGIVKSKIKKTAKTFWENKEVTIPATVTLLTAGTSFIGKVNKHKELKEQEIRRKSSFYERREGLNCYYETKRPLTAKEMEELEQRRLNGELYGTILRDMNLLKRVR